MDGTQSRKALFLKVCVEGKRPWGKRLRGKGPRSFLRGFYDRKEEGAHAGKTVPRQLHVNSRKGGRESYAREEGNSSEKGREKRKNLKGSDFS